MVPGACAGGTLRASLAGSGIALRPATLADAEFCYQLHKAAMGKYITAIWGWDEQVQRAFHQRAFNPRRWQIITAGQAGVGMLDVKLRCQRPVPVKQSIRPGQYSMQGNARFCRVQVCRAVVSWRTALALLRTLGSVDNMCGARDSCRG